MKKILLLSILGVTSSMYANEYTNYQAFDNQFNLSYGYNQGNLENSIGNLSLNSYSTLGLEVERILDFGLWFDINASLMLNYNNFGSTNPNAKIEPIGQDPNIGDFITKVGYAIPLNSQLLVIPYTQLAKNTNMSSNSFNDNATPSPDGTNSLDTNVTKDYYIGLGAGARVQYLFNDMFSGYFDQNVAYNIDMSNPNSNYSPSNNWEFISELGVKAKVYKAIQLSLSGFYEEDILNVGNPNMLYQLYPSNKYGVKVGLGMTY